jgi:hypothetical protein
MPDNFIRQGKCLARLCPCFMLTYLDAIFPNTPYFELLRYLTLMSHARQFDLSTVDCLPIFYLLTPKEQFPLLNVTYFKFFEGFYINTTQNSAQRSGLRMPLCQVQKQT